ncbi:hypothetical protein ACP4OV_011643 [Aristida adscensionis]
MEGPSPKTAAVAPAAGPVLPDDAVVEIFKLLPARSLHRFKCVSRAWCGLVADPIHREGYAQTLAGFFLRAAAAGGGGQGESGSLGGVCEAYREGAGAGACADAGESSTRACRHRRRFARRFLNLSRMAEPLVDAGFPFLPPGDEEGHRDVILDSRDGLLLLGRFRTRDAPAPLLRPPLRYLVCNPATEQFAAVPGSGWTPSNRGAMVRTYLLFDLAPGEFHLVQFWIDDMDAVRAVHTYSSAAAAWTDRAAEWLAGGWRDWARGVAPIQPGTGSAVVGGMLHLVVDTDGTAGPNNLVAVDAAGATRRTIPLPRRDVEEKDWYSVFLARSQGSLHFVMCVRPGHGRLSEAAPLKLLVWVLEDYDAGEWVLKHTVSFPELFGRIACQFRVEYSVVAVHPDGNWVFFLRHWDRKLAAYDMDRREVLDVGDLGLGDEDGDELPTPYVPLYMKLPMLTNKH